MTRLVAFCSDWLGTVVPESDGSAKVAAADCNRRRVALLLDVDGTLLDLAPRPDEVVMPARLVRILTRLYTALGGALALVSGRTIRQIDAFLTPLELPCGGVHGGERRDCIGHMHYLAQSSLAVHFRERPELEGTVQRKPSS